MDIKNDPRYVHETVIRDIISVIDDITDQTKSLSDRIGNGTNSFRNIARASRDLTLTFPVIVTNKTSVETGSMIAKAVERKAVSMLQMLFNAINITNANDAFKYLKNFHTNLDTDGNMGIDDIISFANQLSTNESTGFKVTDKALFETAMSSFKKFREYTLSDSINEQSLNSFTINPDRNMVLQEGKKANFTDFAKLRKLAKEQAKAMASKENPHDPHSGKPIPTRQAAMMRANVDTASNQIYTTDIKKANELMPTMMVVHFTYLKDNGTATVSTSAVIGIKGRLQYVTSEDMLNRIIAKNEDRNGLFNFLKATTGQISFWKDFVFAINKAKIDSISSSGKGSSSPIWKLLEHRAIKSKIRRWTGAVNDASAITTLVITKDEADWLKKEERIDVMRPNVIHSIMNAYNIMAFVVVDEPLEQISFLYDDGSNSYETMSFSHLEREDNNDYKKVISLLAKSK